MPKGIGYKGKGVRKKRTLDMATREASARGRKLMAEAVKRRKKNK